MSFQDSGFGQIPFFTSAVIQNESTIYRHSFHRDTSLHSATIIAEKGRGRTKRRILSNIIDRNQTHNIIFTKNLNK
jgi:hypothetical protein